MWNLLILALAVNAVPHRRQMITPFAVPGPAIPGTTACGTICYYATLGAQACDPDNRWCYCGEGAQEVFEGFRDCIAEISCAATDLAALEDYRKMRCDAGPSSSSLSSSSTSSSSSSSSSSSASSSASSSSAVSSSSSASSSAASSSSSASPASSPSSAPSSSSSAVSSSSSAASSPSSARPSASSSSSASSSAPSSSSRASSSASSSASSASSASSSRPSSASSASSAASSASPSASSASSSASASASPTLPPVSSSSSSAAPSSSSVPPVAGVALHPNYNSNKCLDVRDGAFYDGAAVQIYDCNGTPAQRWVLNRGSTKVQLAGTNYCLDAGANPYNGQRMKIWTCYSGLPAQQWWYTADNRIALQDQGFCLDLTDGVLSNWYRTQIWRCTDYNINQIWTT